MMTVVNNSLKIVDALWPGYGVEYGNDADLAAVPLFRDYPELLLRVASVCCVIFVLIGIPGNLITIIALVRYKKVRNATAIFIINLQISDLIFCCTVLPMTAITFAQKHWTHGVTMCRMYPFIKFGLNATSIFTILAITINRYVIVCHPLMYPRLYRRRNISITLIMIWILAFSLFLPSTFGAMGRFDLEPNGGFCTMLKDKHNTSPKTFFLCIAFIGPYLTIALCYARIWWVVRKTARKSQGQSARPTDLAIPQTQSNTSNNGNGKISFEASVSANSCIEDEIMCNSSAASTPNEDKTLENYFKAPFRLTRKELKSKAPTRRDKKLCTMIAAIMLSFCISHLPIMMTRILYKEYKSEPIANVFAHLLEYSGMCINPIIYVLMSNEYRRAYKSLLESIMKMLRRH